MKGFVNRKRELSALNQSNAPLRVIFGRRRIGKTSLVIKWGHTQGAVYSQAIEGSEIVQIEQLVSDLREILPVGLQPRSLREFFALLKTVNKQTTIIIDEFPYLVQNNPALPSMLQKFVDHDQPQCVKLALLGSSQTMMHGLFLRSDSPLYDRAGLVLKVEPMSYAHFCEASGRDPHQMDNFLVFSMVGGVPRYWQYVEGITDPVDATQVLFFERSARLEDEPDRLLRDEGITGLQAKAIFESIGRGAMRPSEIASRIGIPQTGLSKPLGILMNTNLVKRDIPFGESPRNSKKTSYSIDDHALQFWYQVYSPHRSRWHHYDRKTKLNHIHDHAAKVLEKEYRKQFPDAMSYWEAPDIEFDSVRYFPGDLKKVIVSEIKLRSLRKRDRELINEQLAAKYQRSLLSKRFAIKDFEVLDGHDVLNSLVSHK